MKYWIGKAGTAKEGKVGTAGDTDIVPDSDPATKAEYDAYVATFIPDKTAAEWNAEYAAAATPDQKLAVIAQRLKLV